MHILDCRTSHLIAEHHEYLKEMLGENRRLLPKHHFLVHYPSCLLQAGPPVRYWSMRFEVRHQIFKDLAKSTHCFKNICLTLAKRFQLALAYKFLNNIFDSQLFVAGQSEVTINTLPADIMSSICTDLEVCHMIQCLSYAGCKLGITFLRRVLYLSTVFMTECHSLAFSGVLCHYKIEFILSRSYFKPIFMMNIFMPSQSNILQGEDLLALQ